MSHVKAKSRSAVLGLMIDADASLGWSQSAANALSVSQQASLIGFNLVPRLTMAASWCHAWDRPQPEFGAVTMTVSQLSGSAHTSSLIV